MLLDRDRVARLIELSELERRVTGPERLLREADVAVFVKGAYDDASEEARATFMLRVSALPTSAWPWTAVQPMSARGGSGRGLGLAARPATLVPPPALILLRGQLQHADADPGNRIPEQGDPDGGDWSLLHGALDAWDTQTLKKWIGPRSWVMPSGITAGNIPAGPGDMPPVTGTGNTGIAPPGVDPGVGTPGAPGTSGPGPAPAPAPSPASTWRHPAVLAAGATVASTLGVVLFSLRAKRSEPAAPEDKP